MRHLQESSIQEKRLDNALITELKEKVSSLKDKLLALEKEKVML